MKVILHIGATKTGSSALQDFLYQNMRVLRSKGICYPDVGIVSGAHHLIAAALHPSAHRLHSDALPDTPQAREEQFHTYVAAARREAEAMKAETLILSSEYLWGDFSPAFYDHWKQAVTGAQVTIYGVLRDPRNWVPSSYIQAIKGGEARSLEEWFEWRTGVRVQPLDYTAILSGWRALGPETQFALRSYEQMTAQDEIFANLLRLCGIKRYRNSDYYQNSRQINPSPSPKAIELLRNINKSDLDGQTKGSLRKLILTHMGKKKSGTSWDILDEGMTSKIEGVFDPILERLLSEFDTSDVEFVRGYLSKNSSHRRKASWLPSLW